MRKKCGYIISHKGIIENIKVSTFSQINQTEKIIKIG